MTLKVEQFNSQDTPQFSTDLIRFLYSDANKRIQLSFLCNPQVFIMPTKQNDGLIRINRQKKIALKKMEPLLMGHGHKTECPLFNQKN